MVQSIEEGLFKAIKKDDVKAFDAYMETTRGGAYRLGRFPVLSLLYLYKSRKILSSYEEKFLQITSYEVLREPLEISKKFSAKAGKCLRLYLNEVVSPLEMLLILDRTRHLKQVFPRVKPSSQIKWRLKSIYSIKYALGVKFEGDNIIIDRRPLSYREKRKIFTISLSVILALIIVIGVPVTTVSLIPKPVEGEVTTVDQIKFDSSKEYTFMNDIILPENYSIDKVNCKIIGGGKKLILGKGASLGELNGEMSDLIIESEGNAIFTSVSEKATLKNVTVNVKADISTEKGSAFVAVTNYGTIDGVTLNVSGKVNALATSSTDTSDLTFGGIVQTNAYTYSSNQTIYKGGVIKNCTVNYSKFELVGQTSANAAFGGIAGVNSGFLQNCKVTGEIISDTFDIAGMCTLNEYLLSENINEANLTQTSSDTAWNPIACGIVLTNAFAVENCKNLGKISSTSVCGQFEMQEGYESIASAAGIAYLNRDSSRTPYIKDSINSGIVESSAKYRHSYAAGICLSSSGVIQGCTNSGFVSAKTENGCDAYAGGIATISFSNINKCINDANISAVGSGEARVGGISAQALSLISYCHSVGNITASASTVIAGGILGFSDVDSYGMYVYVGSADHCISESKIDVTATGEKPAYVGGIVGQVSEQGFTNNSTSVTTYFGGSVTNSIFIGECEADYFGNIVGVCGKNVYTLNSYTTNTGSFSSFDGNIYINNAAKAFGATLSSKDALISVDDKGAKADTLENIQNSDIYKAILNALQIEQ